MNELWQLGLGSPMLVAWRASALALCEPPLRPRSARGARGTTRGLTQNIPVPVSSPVFPVHPVVAGSHAQEAW